MNPHEKTLRFSLAIHRLTARRIRKDPSVLEIARERNEQRGQDFLSDGVTWGYPFEWREILELPAEEVARIITRRGSEMDRLRSSSPFPSTLTDIAQRKRLARKMTAWWDRKQSRGSGD
jgi:hypothetical protein